jgi:hypothetical protein
VHTDGIDLTRRVLNFDLTVDEETMEGSATASSMIEMLPRSSESFVGNSRSTRINGEAPLEQTRHFCFVRRGIGVCQRKEMNRNNGYPSTPSEAHDSFLVGTTKIDFSIPGQRSVDDEMPRWSPKSVLDWQETERERNELESQERDGRQSQSILLHRRRDVLFTDWRISFSSSPVMFFVLVTKIDYGFHSI